jgi:hypothetical protein
VRHPEPHENGLRIDYCRGTPLLWNEAVASLVLPARVGVWPGPWRTRTCRPRSPGSTKGRLLITSPVLHRRGVGREVTDFRQRRGDHVLGSLPRGDGGRGPCAPQQSPDFQGSYAVGDLVPQAFGRMGILAADRQALSRCLYSLKLSERQLTQPPNPQLRNSIFGFSVQPLEMGILPL